MNDNLFNTINFEHDSKKYRIGIKENSKWTTELKTLINSETGKPYERYITIIEADPSKGYGYKRGHKIVSKYVRNSIPGTSHNSADYIKLETINTLTLNEPILKFAFMQQDDGRFPWTSFDFIEFDIQKESENENFCLFD